MSAISGRWSSVFRNLWALLPRGAVRISPWLLLAIVALPVFAASHVATAPPGFVAEKTAATRSMVAAMDRPSSGDPDRDFASMMIAHHEGAMAMARTELHYGRNPSLRAMAQHIVDTQGQEIEAMRNAAAR